MGLHADRGASPAQFRAARAMLDWSLTEAARRAGVSISTTLKCERIDRGPPGEAEARALTGAYRMAGVRFLPSPAEGVELLHAAGAGRRAD